MLTFSEFWAIYPKRKGANPRALAEKKFNSAIRSGVDPERIINSAKRYADELRETEKLNTEFVCQAATWLNQRRFEDYAPDPGSKERDAKIDADMKRRGYEWDGSKWQKVILLGI
jgi:hypothetical protein